MKQQEENIVIVEESLGAMRDGGGDVRYKKDTNNVDVLWIQTNDMRKQVTLFECDTAFGTQNEVHYELLTSVH